MSNAADFAIRKRGKLMNYMGSDEHVVIPDGVRRITDCAFANCSEIKSITMPNGVTRIDEKAFAGCKNLEAINLPDSLISIGDRAFAHCQSLKNITIPDSTVNLGEEIFIGCEKLADADGLVIVRNVLYDYFGNGGDVVIPDGVIRVGDKAFVECNIKSITIPDSVTCIGRQAFHNCENLKKVIISNSVTDIQEGTFSNCQNLENVVLPSGLIHIQEDAFSNCEKLADISIPEKTSIDERAFLGCKKLADAEGFVIIHDQLHYYCGEGSDVVIPDGVKHIEESAFEDCASLTNVIIPDSVTIIGEYAFIGCGKLRNVVIPESVTWIYDDAFSGVSIYGYVWSEAEKYAEENDFPFVTIMHEDYAELVQAMRSTGDSEDVNCNDYPKKLHEMLKNKKLCENIKAYEAAPCFVYDDKNEELCIILRPDNKYAPSSGFWELLDRIPLSLFEKDKKAAESRVWKTSHIIGILYHWIFDDEHDNPLQAGEYVSLYDQMPYFLAVLKEIKAIKIQNKAKAMCDKLVHTFVHERYEYDDENEFVDDMTERLPEVYLDYDLIHNTISVKLDIGSGYTLTSMDADLYKKDRSAAEEKVHTAELAIRILYDEMITISENPLRSPSWVPLHKQLADFKLEQ